MTFKALKKRQIIAKVLRDEICAENPELVARFEHEARATGSPSMFCVTTH